KFIRDNYEVHEWRHALAIKVAAGLVVRSWYSVPKNRYMPKLLNIPRQTAAEDLREKVSGAFSTIVRPGGPHRLWKRWPRDFHAGADGRISILPRTADGPRPLHVDRPSRSAKAQRLRARLPAANRDGSRSGGGGAEMRPVPDLVWCLRNNYTFVALKLAWGEARRRECIPSDTRPTEQRSPRPISAQPKGRHVFWAEALLLAPHRSTAGYARRSRLASAQNPLPRMYSYFGDTTLETLTWRARMARSGRVDEASRFGRQGKR